MTNLDNFIECTNVEDANKVDLEKYTFVGFRHEFYVFKVRQR